MDFSDFYPVGIFPLGEEFQRLILFFLQIGINVRDVTTDLEKANYQKVVEVTYSFQNKRYVTKPLYYKNVLNSSFVKDGQVLINYFGGDVYWLDNEKHGWPQSKGETDIDKLIIDDIADDEDFKSFLKSLANNGNNGAIQRITSKGKPGQYYRNLENNNHWHDLILLIQEAILTGTISKDFFKPLVFRWGGNNKTDRLRVSLSPNFGSRSFIGHLLENIRKYKPSIADKIGKVKMDKEIVGLLEYKKQIILQGPPGTGKTRLAKEIAENLIGQSTRITKPASITNQQIIDTLKGVRLIKSVAGKAEYKLINVDLANEVVVLKKETEKEGSSSFKNIKESFRTKSFLNDDKRNDHRRTSAIANYIYQNIKAETVKLEDSNQFKLVQFHPSYTYEDFVRGIVAKPNPAGDGVLYVAENKVLGEFAKQALDNYLDSKKPIEVVSKEVWVRERIKGFQKYLEEKLDNKEKIWLTEDTAYITRITKETIRYKGDKWTIDGGVPYPDLEKMFLADVSSLTEIRELESLTLSAKSNTTYWQKALKLFKDYLKANGFDLPKDNTSDKISIKNYVLIIDEINRANLSSVLGELIYALEYRGEGLDGMYAVDDSGDEKANKKLILPPNLYIIGTMNTADRSVGHIDYAIRRRFAFVDIPPEDLTSTLGADFKSDLFNKVRALFTDKHVSPEFKAKDVQLGHSYFIQQYGKDDSGKNSIDKPYDFNMRLKYEIVPILNEYLNDGVFNNDAETLSKIQEIKDYLF